jgi:ATP-binding cassette, subfamily C, type I secretion system permease/ATPase
MARAGRTASEALLEDAIEDVLRVMSRWLWLILGMGVVGTLLAMTALASRYFIFVEVPRTHSVDSLVSALIFVLIVSVAIIAFRSLERSAISRVARYLAGRLAVPAVMATANRAGRPETLANHAIRDVETMRETLAGPVSSAVLHAALTPLLLALAFLMHWYYGVIAVVFCAVAALLSVLITRAIRRAAEIGGAGANRAAGLAADAMRSGEAVLAMGMLPRLMRQWIEVSTASAGEAWVAERRAARLRTMLETMLGSYRGMLLLVGALIALSGEMTVPAAVGSLFIMMRIPEPFVTIGTDARDIAEGLAAWQRLRTLVHGSPVPPDGLAFPCTEGRLVAERVGFGFRGPQPPLFRNLELRVEPGEIVAIIGPSGSGKSTLLRLLIGMYRPNSGGIFLDGCAVHQWDRRDLARHLGFLPQEPLLSRGTAAEVIARLEVPDMHMVLDASRRAGAHETVVRLPLGYATPITGQPQQLSMGQRHRIAIARALYGRPRVLVMDEVAASLDAAGEAQVAQLLAVLREEGTSVVFTTHRPALLAVADRILALRNGQLVPAGEEPPPPRLGGRQARIGRAAAPPPPPPREEARA